MTLDTALYSPNGAKYDSPGQRPGTRAPHIFQALKGRPIR